MREAHCNTLQHTATHCNTLQHTAAYCNTLQHTATHGSILPHPATLCHILQSGSAGRGRFMASCEQFAPCNILQHTGTNCHTLQHTAAYCSTLQNTATHCHILSYIATHCNLAGAEEGGSWHPASSSRPDLLNSPLCPACSTPVCDCV